jgi:hypothetical protein
MPAGRESMEVDYRIPWKSEFFRIGLYFRGTPCAKYRGTPGIKLHRIPRKKFRYYIEITIIQGKLTLLCVQGNMDENMKTWRHGDMETLRHRNMETWRQGNVETWARVHGHKDMDMKTWMET